jgi:DNA-binding FadR family transcriptional regulator
VIVGVGEDATQDAVALPHRLGRQPLCPWGLVPHQHCGYSQSPKSLAQPHESPFRTLQRFTVVGKVARLLREMRSDQFPRRLLPGQRRYVQVADEIVASMGSGELQPGDRLPSDRQLAEMMAVSRPTVREALLALEFVGLVQIRPGDGVYVADKDARSGFSRNLAPPNDFSLPPQQLIEARIAVEPSISRLCASRVPKKEMRSIEALVDRTERVAQHPAQLDEFVELGLGFHKELAPLCGNEFLSSFCRSLVSVTEHPLWALVNRQAMREHSARLGQVTEHRAVLEAIGNGDADGACEAMSNHLERLRGAIFGGSQSRGRGQREVGESSV